jgi:hypothetical protein
VVAWVGCVQVHGASLLPLGFGAFVLTGCGEGYVYVQVDDHESWVRRLEVHHLFLWRHVEHDMPGCFC